VLPLATQKVEAAGIEPALKFSAISEPETTCVICPSCGAALALQDSGTNRHVLSLDDRIAVIVRTLPYLSDQMLKIVEAVCLQPASQDIAVMGEAPKSEFPPPRERAIDLSTRE
jgi:hypothetical protein